MQPLQRVHAPLAWLMTVWALALLALAVVTAQPSQPARAVSSTSTSMLGGPRGDVSGPPGTLLEGIGIQLIADRTAIRTTVYTNDAGQYRFPVLEAGSYTLRLARPMEFKPFVKKAVHIEGSVTLPDIPLERVSKTEFLPPTDDILSQLTGTEWMMNLPGTGEEKRVFTTSCLFGCHSLQQVFRNTYDERSWRLIYQRMIRSGSSPLIRDTVPTPTTLSRSGRLMLEEEEFMPKWLARVRGPESKLAPLHYLPRETGRATRVIVTEYELPRELTATHDVHGDSKGNIWFTTHRSAHTGVLDPRTGIVTEHRIPEKEKDTPGALPGQHRVFVDKNDVVWFWEGWDNYLTGLDAKTGKIKYRHSRGSPTSLNAPGGMGGPNFAMDDAGFVYQIYRDAESSPGTGGMVLKTDPHTGEIVNRFPLKKTGGTYDNMVSGDGRYWAGGLSYLDMKTGESWEPEVSPDLVIPARGAFDLENNAWIGGRGGMLIKHDAKTHRIQLYRPPIGPYETFYEAMPDKNGEIWAGGLHSGRFWRFNPKTQGWTGYMMPEPYAHDRRTWIDNSTNPVTVWFVDQAGYMVRIQPLD
jgi:streptogramin lyase